MKFGIVGNNDGPLYLLEGIRGTKFVPEFVGIQKPISNDLKALYYKECSKDTFFEGFDEAKLLRYLENYDINLLINCFCNFRFRKILSQSFPVLNIHLSPLPAYRGRHPLQWALINGEKEFGFSIHKMTEKFDAGEIYWQEKVPVKKGMSVKQLRTKLMKKLKAVFSDFLHEYEKNQIHPIDNNDNAATYISRRYPEDSRLTEWHDSSIIFRKVQALRSEDNPAFFFSDDHKITCLEAKIEGQSSQQRQHPEIYNLNGNRCEIVCTDGELVRLVCSKSDITNLRAGKEIH